MSIYNNIRLLHKLATILTMTTLEVNLKINNPQIQYGITYKTMTVIVKNDENIVDIIVEEIKKFNNCILCRNVVREHITFNSLKIIK